MAQGKARGTEGREEDIEDDDLLTLDVGVTRTAAPDEDDDIPEIDIAVASVGRIMKHYGVDKLTAEQMSQTARGERPGLNSIAVAEE